MAVGAVGLSARASSPAFVRQSIDRSRIKALAFDAFAVFDPRPVFRSCEEAFPSGLDIQPFGTTG